jgi:uncharacterized protein involved in outer membrane biogenesis
LLLLNARELQFTVRLPSLLTSEIIVPYLRATDTDINFVRDALNRVNWKFGDPDQPSKRGVNVRTLTLNDVRVNYRDLLYDMWADLHGFSRNEGPYETRIGFAGRWLNAPFEGTADTGSIVSLRGSDRPFPMRIVGKAGRTSVQAEGQVIDITRFRHIESDFAISGPSLATLYAPLRVALPETPPYRARGRLKRQGDVYSYENFQGRIGNSDVAGSGRYELRKPRPFLTADVRSKLADIADLGPVVGKDDPARTNAAQSTAGATTSPPRRAQSDSVFPQRDFNLEKLNAMDADVRIVADRLRLPEQIPLENFSTHARVEAGVLTLDPLKFGFAGGDIVGTVVLDARENPMAGRTDVNFKRVKLSQLFPTVERLKQSGGSLGAQVRLAGRGNSVADLVGTSNGTVTAGIAGGRVSELAVWLVNLNVGEVIPLLFGGDRPTRVRCGAVALDVKDGVGTISSFVFDTEESRIEGGGSVDLKNERLDITLRPEAKKPGLLSLRGPIRIYGPFRDANFAISSQSIARGAGAVALGVVNPLLALIPLIETGPGEDTDCRAVLEPVRGAIRQSGKSVKEAPVAGEKVSRPDGQAPIVDAPPGKGSSNAERQPEAPIVDAKPGKPDKRRGG